MTKRLTKTSATQKSAQQIDLPEARYFVITWGIPDNFGGMTGAFLHRSRAFVTLGSRTVDVLTFDSRTDYAEREGALRAAGELVDGMRLFNLWEWLRDNEVAPPKNPSSKHAAPERFSPLATGDDIVSQWHPGVGDSAQNSPVENSPVEYSRTRFAADGTTVLQVDHYRADGSLLATDRRDVVERGALGGRAIVLCDQAGTPIRSWDSIWGFYRFWLDRLRRGEKSIMLVDSKTTANFMLGYRRPDAITVHIVHSSHLVGGRSADAPLRESRRRVFEDLSAFDSVIVLTNQQRGDIEARFGPQPQLAVIPNGRDVAAAPTRVDRDERRGVVLASLTKRKRLEHSITAVIAANSTLAPDANVRLDIYGDGEDRQALESAAAKSKGAVQLLGHSSNARAEFASASFMVLSSTSEGFPLVLVEAMAAGCIPIAYDIPYGPADIIVDGVNGYLVAAGDTAALASAIARLRLLDESRIEQMRDAARQTASAFTDLAVTQLWARELQKVVQRQWSPSPAPAGVRVFRPLRRIPALARGLRARL